VEALNSAFIGDLKVAHTYRELPWVDGILMVSYQDAERF